MEDTAISPALLINILECLLPLLERRATVIFTGGGADPAPLLAAVDGILATQAGVVVSDAFARIAPPGFLARLGGRLLTDDSAIRACVAASDIAVVPILTRNTLAKAALGIQDTPATNAIAAALMRGLPVIAVRDACHPGSPHCRSLGYDRNPAYNQMMEAYEERLTAFGVKLADSCEFACSCKSVLYPGLFGGEEEPPRSSGESRGDFRLEGVRLVTCADLMGYSPGCRVLLDAGAVLTPLAKDYAQRGRIALSRLR